MRAICALWVVAGCASWPKLEPTGDRINAEGVVLLDEVSARYFADPVTRKPVEELTRHFRARIQGAGGESLARVVIHYQPAFDQLVSFRARTIASDGSQRQFGHQDGFDTPSYPNFVLYSDQRALVVDLKPSVSGTIVEYEYTLRFKDWRFAYFSQGFAGAFPSRLVRLTVTAPSSWEIEEEARQLNDPVSFSPTVEQLPAETRLTWERRDVPALPSEKLGPPWWLLETRVSGHLQKWIEHGKTMQAPRDAREKSAQVYQITHLPDADEAIRLRAHELVKELPDDVTERVRRLYNWVRDQVSYCAIEIGIGGLRPHSAGEVLKVSYGDCKDKANLLRALLEAIGVHSRLAEIHHHDGFPLRFVLATGGDFNHVILAVDLPGGMVLADPTSRVAPFGTLPLGDQEADYLPNSPGGDPIAQSPASSADENSEEIVFELAEKGANLEGNFHLTRTGFFADSLRSALINTPAAEQWKPLGNALGLVSWRLRDPHIEGGGAPATPTPVIASGAITLLGAINPGATQLLRLSDLIGAAVPSLPGGRRRTPLVLRCRKKIVHRLVIALPDGAETSQLPAPSLLERPFARYQLGWRREGANLVVERSLILSERIFSPAQYPAVKTFFDEILNAEATAVTLRPVRHPQ